MSYKLELAPQAKRDLRKLPRHVKVNISRALQQLAENPRPAGCKKLQGRENEWRIRIGDYRIAYSVLDNALTVYVTEVGKREHFY